MTRSTQEQEPETYVHLENCGNCSHLNTISIPKGATIDKYLTRVYCSNCGVMLRPPTYQLRGGYE